MLCFDGNNALNLISAGAAPRTPLGELTALPQTSSCVLGGEGEEGKGIEGRNRKGDGEGARVEG